MFPLFLFFFAAALLVCGAAGGPLPVISRLSAGGAPPNGTFLIQGAALDSSFAELCPVRGGSGGCIFLPAAQSWAGSAKITLPAGAASFQAFGVRACADAVATLCSKQSQKFSINAPTVNFFVGDMRFFRW